MLKERLESIKDLLEDYNRDEATREILDLAYDYDLVSFVENIADEGFIDELVKNRFDSSGWQGVACMLKKINYLNDEYYFMNGYGNLEELTINRLECIFNDMKEELLNIEEEEEEEE